MPPGSLEDISTIGEGVLACTSQSLRKPAARDAPPSADDLQVAIEEHQIFGEMMLMFGPARVVDELPKSSMPS